MWNLECAGFTLYFLFWNFMLYSFFGWIWESFFVSFKKKSWVNRGFLNGPVIPLYGAGATLVYVGIYPIQEHPTYVFLFGMLLATVLEYVTSYVMEKLFHAKWWDYTNYRYNFQGRICLLASLFWGFLSLLMSDVLQPFVSSIIERIPRQAGEIAGVLLAVVFAADFAVTVIYTVQWDRKLEELERIREEFTEYMESTRLYETKEEIRNRLDGLSMAGYTLGFQSFRNELDEKYDELTERFKEKHPELFSLEIKEIKLELKEDITGRMNHILNKYQKRLSAGSFVEKRLLKAFPTMKLTKNTAFLEDMRVFKDRVKKNKEE